MLASFAEHKQARKLYVCKGMKKECLFQLKTAETRWNTSKYKFLQAQHKFLYKSVQVLRGALARCYLTCWFQFDSDLSYRPQSCSTVHRSRCCDMSEIFFSTTS